MYATQRGDTLELQEGATEVWGGGGHGTEPGLWERVFTSPSTPAPPFSSPFCPLLANQPRDTQTHPADLSPFLSHSTSCSQSLFLSFFYFGVRRLSRRARTQRGGTARPAGAVQRGPPILTGTFRGPSPWYPPGPVALGTEPGLGAAALGKKKRGRGGGRAFIRCHSANNKKQKKNKRN